MNTLKGEIDLDPHRARLKFTYNNSVFQPSSLVIPLEFKDPRNKNELKRILLDPDYDINDPPNPDFFLKTSLKSPKADKILSSSALCDWETGKKKATCSIEDDGGRFFLIVKKRTDDFSTSKFSFQIATVGNYKGRFRIGDEDAVEVELKGHDPVESTIVFK